MIPDNVEKIIMTKEDYDRNVEKLLLDKLELEQRIDEAIEWVNNSDVDDGWELLEILGGKNE